jgi:hypothetical protein
MATTAAEHAAFLLKALNHLLGKKGTPAEFTTLQDGYEALMSGSNGDIVSFSRILSASPWSSLSPPIDATDLYFERVCHTGVNCGDILEMCRRLDEHLA